MPISSVCVHNKLIGNFNSEVNKKHCKIGMHSFSAANNSFFASRKIYSDGGVSKKLFFLFVLLLSIKNVHSLTLNSGGLKKITKPTNHPFNVYGVNGYHIGSLRCNPIASIENKYSCVNYFSVNEINHKKSSYRVKRGGVSEGIKEFKKLISDKRDSLVIKSQSQIVNAFINEININPQRFGFDEGVGPFHFFNLPDDFKKIITQFIMQLELLASFDEYEERQREVLAVINEEDEADGAEVAIADDNMPVEEEQVFGDNEEDEDEK